MIPVRIIGHRGSPAQAPGNTYASFRSALDSGADEIETDVRLTVDGRIVVSHDPDFSRFGGPDTAIRRMSSDDIARIVLNDGADAPQHPLFMEDALRLFPDTRFNVDLKDTGGDIVQAWADLLRRTGAADRCRTASFYDRSLRIFRRRFPRGMVSVARFGIAWLLLLSVLGLSRRPREREDVLQIPETAGALRLVSPRTIRLWHRYGWKIEVWTIDNEKDAERLIDWGVDGLITNRPSLVRALLNHRSSEEIP